MKQVQFRLVVLVSLSVFLIFIAQFFFFHTNFSSPSSSSSSSSDNTLLHPKDHRFGSIRIESSPIASSSKKNSKRIVTSNNQQQQHFLAGYSGASSSYNKWRSGTCMNYFDSFNIVRKVKKLINWSTPLFQNEIYFPNTKQLEFLNRKEFQRNFEAKKRKRKEEAENNGTPVGGENSEYTTAAASSQSATIEKKDAITPYCSYWSSGKFLKEFVEGTVFSQSRAFYKKVAVDQIPDMCLTPSSNSNNKTFGLDESKKGGSLITNKRVERDCSTGLCLAHSLASLIKGPQHHIISNSDKKFHQKTSTPAFLLLIGDSRVRNLFQRLIMMIRSNKKSGFEEMNRTGVSDNYFHQNATYTIWRRSGRDEIRVLPIGIGCDSQEMVLNSLMKNSTTYREGEENNENNHQDEVLLMICLEWHFRTTLKRVTSWDIDMKKVVETSKPDSVIWMPTLHDCVRRMCDQSDAHVGNLERFSKMLVDELDVKRSIKNKLIFLTTPSASWASPAVIRLRNDAMKRIQFLRNEGQLASYFNVSSSSSSNTNTNIVIPNNKNKLKIVDFATYIQRTRPVRCDRVHNMCNFRPIMKDGNVTHFRVVCDGCRDIPDYCAWMQLRKALV